MKNAYICKSCTNPKKSITAIMLLLHGALQVLYVFAFNSDSTVDFHFECLAV